MNDLTRLAQVFETLLSTERWRTEEARAILRAGRALAREEGRPGDFDLLLFKQTPVPPSIA